LPSLHYKSAQALREAANGEFLGVLPEMQAGSGQAFGRTVTKTRTDGMPGDRLPMSGLAAQT
jgi:hypothetical protein